MSLRIETEMAQEKTTAADTKDLVGTAGVLHTSGKPHRPMLEPEPEFYEGSNEDPRTIQPSIEIGKLRCMVQTSW